MIRLPPTEIDRSWSPSFTGNSSNNLADIAARVVEEFRNQNGLEDDDDIYNFDSQDTNDVYVPVDDVTQENMQEISEDDSDGEFEFAVVSKEYDSSTVGENVTRYPLFDQSLLLDDSGSKFKAESVSLPVRRPLRMLFERESDSCSSSDADELDGAAPGTYCIWKPKKESVENCKKSNSTGSSSKRWKFRNLIHRSHSDGRMDSGKNGSVIVLRQLTAKKKRSEKVEKTAKVAGADDADEPAVVTKGSRIQSNRPRKPDLVGVFANVNGLSRNLHPF